MKQTLMIKLATDEEQHEALLQTMVSFNEACNAIADTAFGLGTANKFSLQKAVYHELRSRFGLSAQMTIRAISKVSEAYKRDRSIKPTFKPHSAIVYDQRILSWKGLDKVSLLSLNGRLIIATRIGAYQQARLDRKVRQTDLILREGIFYLAVVVDALEPIPDSPVGTLGVDLGVVNLAVDSDGKFYSGENIDNIREKIDALKASLQSKDTKSSKRHLKRLSGRESRFRRSVNHNISKQLVSKAKDTHRQIALEDLGGISDSTVRHSQRRRHKSWAFSQLRSFIEYKAKIAGVIVKVVDPRNTSRTCPQCGFVSKSNRKSQSLFSCQQCGFASNADIVGATNISRRAPVNEPIVSPAPVGAWAGTSSWL
jgi:IS605 OrfB family transposase